MNITSTTQRGANTSFTSYADREIQSLMKQKMQLQEQIKKVSEGKMDAKAKQEKIKELNENILNIESQIRQKQMEKITKEAEKAQAKSLNSDKEKNSEEDESKEKVVLSQGIISAGVGYAELKTIGRVRTKLKGELRIATQSGDTPGAGQGIQNKIDKLEKDMMKKKKEIDSDLKKANKGLEEIHKNKEKEIQSNKVDNEKTLKNVAETEKIEMGVNSPESTTNEDSKNKSDMVRVTNRQRKIIDIRI